MNTYQEYLEMPLSLTFEDMNRIHTQMVAEIGTTTTDLTGLHGLGKKRWKMIQTEQFATTL